MLRRMHWAPVTIAITFGAWGVVTGCQQDSTLDYVPPVAQGGATNTVATGGVTSTNGGNTYLQGGQTAVGQGGAQTTGQGGATAKGGATGTATGGATGKGGATGNGGATTPATGGTTATATGGATAATGGAPIAQTCTTDLMTLAGGDKYNWIVNTTGKSCAVQGALYAFGDGTSLTKPAAVAGSTTDRETPCAAPATAGGPVKCCISGTTVVGADATYWGAGLGLDLNASSAGAKSPYAGAAKGFSITLTGTFPSATAKLRIAYAGAGITTEPFKEIPAAAGTYKVLFSDATCPSWATAAACAPVTAPTQVKVQIVGGGTVAANVGAFDFCIASILPL